MAVAETLSRGVETLRDERLRRALTGHLDGTIKEDEMARRLRPSRTNPPYYARGVVQEGVTVTESTDAVDVEHSPWLWIAPLTAALLILLVYLALRDDDDDDLVNPVTTPTPTATVIVQQPVPAPVVPPVIVQQPPQQQPPPQQAPPQNNTTVIVQQPAPSSPPPS